MGIKVLAVNAICILLSGCMGIFGFWMNGNPAVGENITPMRDYWILPGGTAEERTRQWIACGGLANGKHGAASIMPLEKLTPKQIFEADMKKAEQVQNCMLDEGYRYVGQCKTDITRRFPGCRKPSVN